MSKTLVLLAHSPQAFFKNVIINNQLQYLLLIRCQLGKLLASSYTPFISENANSPFSVL